LRCVRTRRRRRTPQRQPETAVPDQSGRDGRRDIQAATQVDDLNAKIELLQAQVEALQEALEKR
jgi:hypothetical protein